MKICVVGCGAIGSLFAGHLARLEDVAVYAFDINEAHVNAIRKQGLRLSGEADFTVRLEATSDPGVLPQCDFGVVVTKSMHTRSAIEATAHAFSQGAVCSVQNGAGNEEILADPSLPDDVIADMPWRNQVTGREGGSPDHVTNMLGQDFFIACPVLNGANRTLRDCMGGRFNR